MNSINSTSETVLAPCLSDLSFKRRDSVELGGLSSGAGRRAHKRAKIAPAAQRPARIPHSSLFSHIAVVVSSLCAVEGSALSTSWRPASLECLLSPPLPATLASATSSSERLRVSRWRREAARSSREHGHYCYPRSSPQACQARHDCASPCANAPQLAHRIPPPPCFPFPGSPPCSRRRLVY
ncbi:hypothetical protein B0H12DRAFT_440609 [Mycena haematopus]|nr:hypothetical protein B0H12DRAFT_440609 [Mycena haematopus]